MPLVSDQLGRPLHDLRISVTDRCNFRCTYCMPKEVFGASYRFLPRAELLTFEEIARLARIFVELGVKKLRVTGGEPLLRKELPELIRMLAATPGAEDLALTTNGALLKAQAAALKEAGLKRVTVSLDALDPQIFAKMNGTDFPVARVLEGIEAARTAGFSPIKINAVIRRGINESEIQPLQEHFLERCDIVRFIEYMDVGNTNHWSMKDVVPADEIVARISQKSRFLAIPPSYTGEVAQRWVDQQSGGEVGVIASVTQPFCVNCSRARISSDGKLYTCLFAGEGFDLRRLLRETADDGVIRDAIRAIWSRRGDRYSELRELSRASATKVEMSAIGG